MFEKVPSIDKAPTVDKKIELPQNCPYLLQKINTETINDRTKGVEL